jgi:hypothetical protein
MKVTVEIDLLELDNDKLAQLHECVTEEIARRASVRLGLTSDFSDDERKVGGIEAVNMYRKRTGASLKYAVAQWKLMKAMQDEGDKS